MTFSDLFGLVIPFDGSDEMNISQMLFDILYKMGVGVQSMDHGSNEMDEKMKNFCFLLKSLSPETAISMAYRE